MHTKSKSLIMAAGASLLLAGGCTTPRLAQWEYKVARPPRVTDANTVPPKDWLKSRQEFLNDLGKEGWVLVSQTDGNVFYLKRPLR